MTTRNRKRSYDDEEGERKTDHDTSFSDSELSVKIGASKKNIDKGKRPLKSRKTSKFLSTELDDDDDSDKATDTDMHDIEERTYKETGQIIKIDVENFMCHRKFTVSFGRHVNFITGSNGSGKSAIVSAVQLCLGAGAKVTGRGSNLAGFVKEGTDGPATAQVTLLNEGDDAYRPDLYGNRIVIERKISKSGVSTYSTYKLNNQKRLEAVSHEKREVDDILKYFNIYVDNPCCVLTQEEAKRFIQGEEKEKYDFFLKASGLYRAKEELLQTKKFIEDTIDKKNKCLKSLESKEVENRKLCDHLHLWENFDKEESRIKILEAKVFWAHVYAFEKKLNNQNNKVKELQMDCDEKEQRIENSQAEADETANFESITKVINEIQSEVVAVNEQINKNKQSVNEVNSRVNQMKNQIADYERTKREGLKRIKTIESEIHELNSKAFADATGIERKLLSEISDISTQLNEQQESDNDIRRQISELMNNKRQMDDSIRDITESIRSIQSEIGRLQSDRQALISSTDSNSRIAKFGPQFPELATKISQTRFQGPVLGPIGSFVSLNEGYERSSFAIERALSGIMTSFIVTTMDDLNRLQSVIDGVFRRHYNSPRIIVQVAGSRYSNTEIRMIPNARTILHAIKIENDIVFNCIVDQTRPEATVLINDENDLRSNYLSRDERGLTVLRDGIARAISHNGITYTYRYGNQSAEEPTSSTRSLLLSQNNEEIINNYNEQIHNKSQDLSNMQDQLRVEQQRCREYDHQNKILQNQQASIATRIRNLMKQKSDRQHQMNEVRELSNIDTSGLETEKNEIQVNLVNIEDILVEKKNDIERLMTELNQRKQDRQETERQKSALEMRLTENENILKQSIHNHKLIKSKLISIKNEYQAIQTELNKEKLTLSKLQSEHEQLIETASIETRRLLPEWDENPLILEANETIKDLERSVKALRIDMKQQKEEFQAIMKQYHHSIDNLIQVYETSTKDLESTKSSYEKFCENIDSLTEDYELRSSKWKQQRKKSCEIVNEEFDANLNSMGFSGRIEFMHKDGTLALHVQTDSSNDRTRAADVRQISGGERSYVALCFLLALGHVIESPFRIMDEYDVFLDNDARNHTLQRLQEHALEPNQRSRQFFIITPHNLNNIRPSDYVRILVVPPPSNVSAVGPRQTILNF